MRMPFAPTWRAQADSKATSIDLATTVAFGPDIPRVTGPSVVAKRRVRQSNQGHTQAIRIFNEPSIALLVITANSGIRCEDYARADFVLFYGKAKGAFDLVPLYISVCRRHQSFASLTLLAETGYTSPLIASEDGVWRCFNGIALATVPKGKSVTASPAIPDDEGVAGNIAGLGAGLGSAFCCRSRYGPNSLRDSDANRYQGNRRHNADPITYPAVNPARWRPKRGSRAEVIICRPEMSPAVIPVEVRAVSITSCRTYR